MDVREGLVGIISIKMHNPQFEGQTKTRLGNSKVRGIVDSAISTYLSSFLDENPKADLHSAQEAIDDAYRMNIENVNLSLNSINLVFIPYSLAFQVR